MSPQLPLQPDDTIRALEYRIQTLERALKIFSGGIALESGDTRLTLTDNEILFSTKKLVLRADAEISLLSSHIVLKAESDLVLKGARILQN